jgi:hypothetical protein
MRITLPSETLEENLDMLQEIADELDEERDQYHAKEIEAALGRIRETVDQAKDLRRQIQKIEEVLADKKYDRAMKLLMDLESEHGLSPEISRLRSKITTLQQA